jgi:Sigma-70 factor, region 1.1/Sigma-70 factor, region 1.2
MASRIKAPPREEKTPEKDVSETAPDSPVLDLSNAAVKKLIRSAKKRGYVTHDQINSALSSEEVNSEQIEDVLAVFSEMGVNVVETEEASEEGEESREGEDAREEADKEAESESGDLVEVPPKIPAMPEAKEPIERTDDPVRMYLREMGSVELLSREGEIAIAKRIEAGREAMIAGLCESPLTFQAICVRIAMDLNRRSQPSLNKLKQERIRQTARLETTTQIGPLITLGHRPLFDGRRSLMGWTRRAPAPPSRMCSCRFRGEADMPRPQAAYRSVAIDPQQT